MMRVEEGTRARCAIRREEEGGGGEISGLWVRSLKCVCRALKTGNDRKKE